MRNLIKKISILMVIIFTISSILSLILIDKRNELPFNVSQKVRGFYEEPKDSMDIIFVGSSNMFTTINPAVIWREQGIPSYMFGANEQNWGLSYYYVMEVLKYQKPQAIVLDVYYCAYDVPQRAPVIRINLDDMRWSWNKINAIIHNVEPKLWYSYFFPIVQYHDRWKDLSIDDFRFKYTTDYLKGWTPLDDQVNVPDDDMIWSNGISLDCSKDIYESIDAIELPEQSVIWLEDIQNICEENDVELILLLTPNSNQISLPCDETNGYIETDGSQYYKWLEQWASNNDVTFVNMNCVMNGYYHNTMGIACVATSWFGRWYAYTHEYIDRRGDVAYLEYDRDVQKTYDYIKGFESTLDE